MTLSCLDASENELTFDVYFIIVDFISVEYDVCKKHECVTLFLIILLILSFVLKVNYDHIYGDNSEKRESW